MFNRKKIASALLIAVMALAGGGIVNGPAQAQIAENKFVINAEGTAVVTGTVLDTGPQSITLNAGDDEVEVHTGAIEMGAEIDEFFQRGDVITVTGDLTEGMAEPRIRARTIVSEEENFRDFGDDEVEIEIERDGGIPNTP